MRNNVMTGPIILSGGDHAQFRQDVLNPTLEIVSYGDLENPADICLECEDCGEVVLDAEIYTLCARED